MQQALHILKKDIRYLWIEIALALLAAVLLALTGTVSTAHRDAALSRSVITQAIPFLLPIAWWALIVRAVHAETLVGDLEFWPSRPYFWKSLLAAKAMLVLLFVNLPLFLAQALLIHKAGFSVGSQAAGFLWSQVLFTLTVILPVAAIAALTAGIMQFLLIVLAAFVGALLLSTQFVRFTMMMVGSGWGGLEWWHDYYDLTVIALAAVCIIVWQYRTRRTLAARMIGAVAVLIFILGAPFTWSNAFAMQSRLGGSRFDESKLHAGFFTNFKFTARALVNRDGNVSLHIPLELTGVPADMTVKTDGLTYALEAPGGAVWRQDDHALENVGATGQLITLHDTLDGAFYRKVKDQPVKLTGYLYVTFYGNRHVSIVPFDSRVRVVPGMGLCSASGGNGAPYFLNCNAAFRPSPDMVSVTFEPDPRRGAEYRPQGYPSYSPLPARMSLDPVLPFETFSVYKGPLDGVTVTSVEPLAHVRAKIEVDGLRLADYEARLK